MREEERYLFPFYTYTPPLPMAQPGLVGFGAERLLQEEKGGKKGCRFNQNPRRRRKKFWRKSLCVLEREKAESESAPLTPPPSPTEISSYHVAILHFSP